MEKQKYKCRDCGKQFVLNPYPNKISDEIKKLIEELLLEKISLAGISRVTKVSKKWGWPPRSDKMMGIKNMQIALKWMKKIKN